MLSNVCMIWEMHFYITNMSRHKFLVDIMLEIKKENLQTFKEKTNSFHSIKKRTKKSYVYVSTLIEFIMVMISINWLNG